MTSVILETKKLKKSSGPKKNLTYTTAAGLGAATMGGGAAMGMHYGKKVANYIKKMQEKNNPD